MKSKIKNNNIKNRAQKIFEDEFINYINELFAVLSEAQAHGKDNRKKWTVHSDKVKDASGSKGFSVFFGQLKNTHSTQTIYNSHFCHMHILFEKYLLTLIKFSVKTNPDVKKRYNQKFESIGGDTKYAHLNLIKDSRTINQRLNRIDDISQASNGIMNLCKYLFLERDELSKNVGNISNTVKGYKKNVFARYIESKERNNLIKHRGNYFDKTYIRRVTNLIKSLDQKVKFQDILDMYRREEKSTPFEKYQGKKVKIDSFYIQVISSDLFYLTSLFTNLGLKKYEDKIKYSNLFLTLYYKLCFDNKNEEYMDFYFMTLGLISLESNIKLKKKTKKYLEEELYISELICNKLFHDTTPDPIPLDIYINEIKKSDISEDGKKLLEYHLSGKNKDFVEYFSHIAKNKRLRNIFYISTNILFHKFRKNKLFLNALKERNVNWIFFDRYVLLDQLIILSGENSSDYAGNVCKYIYNTEDWSVDTDVISMKDVINE
jgi:hypothetical protein